MVLTSQQRSDVRDVIKDSFNDERFLSTLAQCVADLVIEKLDVKIDALLLKTDDLQTNDKMQLKSSDIHIENCYRIPIKDTNKIRPVVVNFSTLSTRDLVFRSKTRLKGSPIIINEDLTQSNYKLLNTCKTMFGHSLD
ncbi:hypothetical protein WA026_022101 [Henosepilachna vigintioctopunctata]|uniref:Uncharacterized protein n=1 Tax=Henosepilachna vigintioctopunctata TaxID=420089 RepID=A0AAW1UE96_9CUCU